MICPKCGRTVPDGAQCPCSVGTPVLSSNPALNVIKTIGSSPLFLALAVLLSLSAVLSIFSSVGTEDLMSNLYYYAANSGLDPSVIYSMLDFVDGSTIVGAVIGAIPSILIAVGVWMHFATSKNVQSGNISTAGMTICKVLTYISLILMCLLSAFLVVVMIIAVAAAGSISYEYYGYDYGGGVAAGMIVLMVAVLIGIAIFLALYVAYEICVIKTINRIKATALSGVPDNRIPGFLTVINYVFAVFMGISGLASLFSTPVIGIGSLVSAASLVLVSMSLGNYRKQMTMLLYPPVQPVYAAQPPVQGYVAPMPQVPVQPPAAQAPAAPVPPQAPAAPAEPQAPVQPEAPAPVPGDKPEE